MRVIQLGNSAPPIPISTWEKDGVLEQILSGAVDKLRAEYGGTGPLSAEELLGILSTLAVQSEEI